ncbi:MAG: DUF3780 domain-containing protein [Deltaproteobacteria bacterium]|nr:DUF3780 domain-containing protein [Deltaproteobacteria bacterium]
MTEKLQTVDFGAPTTFGAQVFRVEIPAVRTGSVIIVEDYGYRGLQNLPCQNRFRSSAANGGPFGLRNAGGSLR